MISTLSHSRTPRADSTAEQAIPLPSLGGAQPVPVLKANGVVICALRAVPVQMRAPRMARCPDCSDPIGSLSARACQRQHCPIRHDADALHEGTSA